MKTKILFYIFICSTVIMQSHTPTTSQSFVLKNSMLQTIDQAGFFDRAIFDIISARQKIKNFLYGKHLWNGVKLTFSVTNNTHLETIVRRADLVYGATFIVMSPTDENLLKFVTNENKESITKYVNDIKQLSLLQRQESVNYEGFFTGSYATNPFSKKQIPIYVSDYANDLFDTKNNYAHVAIPAHNSKDFEFANKYNLEIQLVATGLPKISYKEQPQFCKDGKTLACAYTKEDDEITIINSDLLNGNPKTAIDKVITFLKESKIGTKYSCPILYEFCGKKYSLENLKIIEETLIKEHLNMSSQQQESFKILMNYAQADFLDIVEPFLKSINAAKDLMIELIEQSCQLRNTSNCYMLKWSQIKSADSEKIIFKRDILTFQELAKFCSDLVNFLGDFASSCPHALDNLKQLKNVHE